MQVHAHLQNFIFIYLFLCNLFLLDITGAVCEKKNSFSLFVIKHYEYNCSQCGCLLVEKRRQQKNKVERKKLYYLHNFFSFLGSFEMK